MMLSRHHVAICVAIALTSCETQNQTPALLALLQSKNSPLTCPPHQYIPETTAGIGFCSVCYSDNRNDGNHLEGQ